MDAFIALFLLVVGLTLGYFIGHQDGSIDVYKGKFTCQTLLNGNIECFDTSTIKGK